MSRSTRSCRFAAVGGPSRRKARRCRSSIGCSLAVCVLVASVLIDEASAVGAIGSLPLWLKVRHLPTMRHHLGVSALFSLNGSELADPFVRPFHAFDSSD